MCAIPIPARAISAPRSPAAAPASGASPSSGASYGAERAAALTQAASTTPRPICAASLAGLPKGRHEAEVLIEDDVTTDDPIRIKVAVTVAGDGLTVDFTGTSRRSATTRSTCPAASTLSMMNYAVKCILAPEIAQNEGCNRPVRLIVPEGTVLNPRRPAAVSVRHLTQQALADCVLKAMAPLAPGRASAGCQVSFPTFCAGGFDDRPGKAQRLQQRPALLRHLRHRRRRHGRP